MDNFLKLYILIKYVREWGIILYTSVFSIFLYYLFCVYLIYDFGNNRSRAIGPNVIIYNSLDTWEIIYFVKKKSHETDIYTQ